MKLQSDLTKWYQNQMEGVQLFNYLILTIHKNVNFIILVTCMGRPAAAAAAAASTAA